jgi:glycerol-3-phosphate O-acyltransferase
MSSADPSRSPACPWWFNLAGQLLQPWVRIRRDPAEPAALLQTGVPVCYVIERDGLSDALILQRACREAGLPSPMQTLAGTRRKRSVFALTRREGWIFGRNVASAAPNEPLRQLVHSLEGVPDRDIQIVPVSIYVGRAPTRDSGWFRVLFSENWVMVGRFRRLLAMLLNGRDTVVHFSAPVSLRSALDEAGEIAPERFTRKIARVLRTHFHRIRAAVIGPDLSHRRTVVDAVLNAEPVRAAIAASAAKEKISMPRRGASAHKLVMEIAADYSHPVVRSVSFLLEFLEQAVRRHFHAPLRQGPRRRARLRSGLRAQPSQPRRLSADVYQLHVSGVVVPHIAAGVNLNLPVVGPILRRGGAFFMRRSFKGNPLYSVVFNEYMAQLIDRGVPIEYFIEGGRSRTGRLLAPRAGMLVDDGARLPARTAPTGAVPAGVHRLREADGRQIVRRRTQRPAEGKGIADRPDARTEGAAPALWPRGIELRRADRTEPDARCRQCRLAPDHTDPDAKPEWLRKVVDDLAERSRSTSTAPPTSIRSTCWRSHCWPRPSTRWPKATCWRSWR